MTSEPCKPCEVDELQAWKCMMESMVKFIQASTKLMNTFNEKANSQMALPQEEFANDCQAPCKYLAAMRPEQESCRKDCKAYNPKKKPNCKKCVQTEEKGTRKKREGKDNLCHPKCKICLPSRIPKCKKCSSDKSLVSSKKGSKSGELADQKSQTEEKSQAEENIQTEEKNEAEEKSEAGEKKEAEEKGQMEDNIPAEQKSQTEETNPNEEQNPTPEGDETAVINEETNVTEEDAVLSPENVDEIVQKEEIDEPKPSLVDCTCQDSESKMISESSCICVESFREEENKKMEKDTCSCPLGSAEKLEITERMQEKLEIAQKEIDQLKKELQQLQFTELTKHSNSAKLYKEIMKESVLDNTFNISSAQRGNISKMGCCKTPCSNFRNKFSVPQQHSERTPLNRERSTNQRSTPLATSSLLGPEFLNGTQADPVRNDPYTSFGSPSIRLNDKNNRSRPLGTSTFLSSELLSGTQSEPASRQAPNTPIGTQGLRCNDNICVRRSKQQRRPNTYNKSASYQTTATKTFSSDYGGHQQSVNQTFQPLYSYYGSTGNVREDQSCECSPIPEAYTNVDHNQYQNWPQQGYTDDTQNNYINNNYISDESCDDTYTCGSEDCPKNRGNFQF